MVWTARHPQCRPMSRNMIFHHQRSLARQSLHPWPLSKVVFSIFFYNEGSVHAADVSAHAEWRTFHRTFRRIKQFQNMLSSLLQRYNQWYSFLQEKGNLWVSLWASVKSLTIITSMLSSWRWMERDLRGNSLVQYSTFLGFAVCSDPKPSHILSLFQHFLGPRRQDTEVVFVLHSVRTSASCPSKQLLSAAKTVKFCSSCSIELIESLEEHIMSSFYEVFLKYLTPSVAHRYFRLRSPLCISASPTSRFFSAGPRCVS